MSKRLSVVLVAALAAVAVLIGIVSASSQGAPGPVAVYPTAGTPVASPFTQVSFRGTDMAGLGQVTVTGSKTGNHTGKLKGHSDHNGSSFVPDKPFAPGETVTVRAGAPLIGAGSDGAVTFTILRPPATPGKPVLRPDPGGHPRGEQHFHSRPDLLPPTLHVLTNSNAAAPGDIFLGVKAGPGADGAAIYDPHGHLVWFRPVPHHTSAADFRVQQYQGNPVLTWWQGRVIFPGNGLGVGLIYDTAYRLIAIVRAGNGYKADLHEFQLTPQGTALMIAYRPVQWNLAPAHGARNGIAVDNVVQEIDVKTGLVEREWHSLGHIGVDASAMKPVPKVPFDGSHVNALEVEPNGNWLISARNTNSAYEVDPNTGNVLWVLGGKRSTFKMGRGAQFVGQHDVRRAPDGNITAFDNGSGGAKPGRASRALELAVNETAKTATVVRAFVHRNPTERTFSQGSVRTLPNRDLFVGWGGFNPYLTEFSPSGGVVFDAKLQPGDDSYRSFKFPWNGIIPAAPPRIAASTAHAKTTVWASWNGATGVASWRVLAGNAANALTPARSASRSGFETAISVSGAPKFVQAQALDATGKVIGTSAVKTPSG